MGKKKLFIVSSFHFSPDRSINEKYNVGEALEARLNVSEAILSTIGNCTYFSDGLYGEFALALNYSLDNLSLEKIKEKNIKALRDGNKMFPMYDSGRCVELVKKLGYDGLDIRFKETEQMSPEEFAPETLKNLSNTKHYKNRKELVKEIIQELEEKAPVVRNGIPLEIKRGSKAYLNAVIDNYRDYLIIKTIIETGSQNNFLFIGLDHNLHYLEFSRLEWYRVDIKQVGEPFHISGILPINFKPNIERIPSLLQSGRPVIKEITYQ